MSNNKCNDKRCADDALEEYFKNALAEKYRPEFAQYAYEILSLPGTQEMLAKKCGVTARTIQRWKKPRLENGKENPFFHEDFALAYLLGMVGQKAGFDEIGLTNLHHPNKHFNPALYFGERKRLHRYSDDRAIKVSELYAEKSFKERVDILTQKLACGEITPNEYNKIMQALAKGNEIIDTAAMKQDVEMLKDAQNAKS